VLYQKHVDVCTLSKITKVILLGPISRCSENDIWTTECCTYGGWREQYQLQVFTTTYGKTLSHFHFTQSCRWKVRASPLLMPYALNCSTHHKMLSWRSIHLVWTQVTGFFSCRSPHKCSLMLVKCHFQDSCWLTSIIPPVSLSLARTYIHGTTHTINNTFTFHLTKITLLELHRAS
jgi:hypothetical protein